MTKQWYVIHTYSGYENKVKTNIEKRVATMNMQEKIFRILVPTQDHLELKSGKKKLVKKKVYPGYVLVEMMLDDDSWYLVRHTPGVTGFVGSGVRPIPLEEDEVSSILHHMGIDEPRHDIDLASGDGVRVVHGPFQNFTGVVEEVYPERGKLRVMVSMFGRETPVELSFFQVEKL
jgi:transcriptional antiterminator NusG